MRDFESYYAAGQTWVARGDPYSADIWKYEQQIPGVEGRRGELLPFIGPPAYLPMWSLFANLPFNVAVILWGAILLAASAAFVIVTLRTADALSAGAFLSAAVLCTSFGPFTSDLSLGQAALLSFVACVGATAMMERAPVLGVAWTFFAALQPNIALGLLSQLLERRAWRVFGVALLIFIALAVGFGGWHGALAYASNIGAHGAAERFALIQMTPAAVAYGFGLSAPLCILLGILSGLAALVACIGITRRPYTKPLWKLAAVLALLPFIVPFFHEHDFVVLLLPAILCATLAEGRAWTIAATGTMLGAVDWLGIAQRPDGAVQSLLLAVSALCALFAIGEVSWRKIIVPACIVALVAAFGILAQHDVAPIWPDAMRGETSMLGGVAAIWHDELLRSGAFATNPLWASMRLLTLAGAVLLAWGTLQSAVRRDQLERS